MAIYHFSIFVDYECRRQFVHLENGWRFLGRYVCWKRREMKRRQKFPDLLRILFREQHDTNTKISSVILKRTDKWQLVQTSRAPRCPEMQEHYFATKIAESQLFAIEGLKAPIRICRAVIVNLCDVRKHRLRNPSHWHKQVGASALLDPVVHPYE